jgi:hypothetical protein
MQNMNLAEGVVGLLLHPWLPFGPNREEAWGHLPFTKSWRGGFSFGGARFSVSNYSLTLLCAHRSGYWDPGFRAIGEDFHESLQAGFKGVVGCPVDVVVNSVHVQESVFPPDFGMLWIKAWWGNVKARYVQAVRHFYANADVSYAIRNAMDVKLWPGGEEGAINDDGLGVCTGWEQWCMRMWLMIKTIETHVLPICSGWIMTFAMPVFGLRGMM